MKLYVRFIKDHLDGIFVCKSFKAYEGVPIEIRVDEDRYDTFPELVVELDTGEKLTGVLDFEAL